MPYSTQSDILKEISEDSIIQLTDDESVGIINTARVTAAIAKADAIIDSYCGQVETVPFTTVPAIIKQHSITIAIYFLYSRRSALSELIKTNYDNAILHLKDIAKGIAVVGATTDGEYADSIQKSHTEDDKKFTMGKESDDSTGTLDTY